MPDTANVESTLIYYRANDKGSVLRWAAAIDNFLKSKYHPGYLIFFLFYL